MFCRWINLHGFAKRSPNLCTVVLMKLLMSRCYLGDTQVIHRNMFNKLMVIKFLSYTIIK